MGYAPVLCCDGLDSSVLKTSTSPAEGVMLLTLFAADAQDDLDTEIRFCIYDKYGEIPIQKFVADAYDAIYAIKLAAEKENVTPGYECLISMKLGKKGMTEDLSLKVWIESHGQHPVNLIRNLRLLRLKTVLTQPWNNRCV